jgi:hypothetical protein
MASAAAISTPASSHHSFAIFDQNQLLTQTGTINNFEWVNPHVWLHLDIPDDAGNVRSWGFEAGNTGQLQRLGWNPENFDQGIEVTVAYRPMKDGSRGGQLMNVTFPDGTTLCSNRGCD